MVTMGIVFTALLLLILTVCSDACPASCTCPSGANQVTCIRVNLTAIPRDIPQTTSNIDLSNNFIEVVTGLADLRNVVSLKLEKNVIQRVEDGALESMGDLQTLDLSQNRLSIISEKSFVGSTQLMHLDLGNNLLQHVDGAFAGMKQLSRLDLSSNQIQRITQFTFRDLESLRYLIISDNQISHVDKRAFKNLEKLMYLVLKGNPIHGVVKFEFNSQVLSYVDLSECELHQIPRGLPNTIRYLQLRRNNLSEIHRRSFRDCPHTSILVLDENGITSIDDRAFEGMDYLQQLWLNGNKLDHVPHPLPASLQRLLMDQNRVMQVTDVFPRRSQIHTLSFMGNNISYVAFDAFNKLKNLVTLDLSNNKINHLYGHTFVNQSKLQSLHISKNPLTHFHSRCLWGLNNLETLSLAYVDTAVSMHPDVFSHLTNLRKINLDSSPWIVRTIFSNDKFIAMLNSVTDLSMQSCELTHLRLDFPQLFANLTTLHISSTRWHCDKNMIWFRNWLKETPIDVINKQEITCFTPRSVHGRSIVSLTDYEFAETTTPLFSTTTTTRVLSTFPSTTTTTTIQPPSTISTSTKAETETAPTVEGSAYHHNADDDSLDNNKKKDNSDEEIGDPFTNFDFDRDLLGSNEDSYPHMTWEEYFNISPYKPHTEKIPTGETRYAPVEQDKDYSGIGIHPVLQQTTASPNPSIQTPDPGGSDASNKTTIIIIVVTIIATFIIVAIIVSLIVYLTRKQSNSKEKGGDYRNGIKYNHKNDVLYFMPNGKAKKDSDTSDSIKTNSTSKEQMTLIPGRDINHEGPLRVYKWEDF